MFTVDIPALGVTVGANIQHGSKVKTVREVNVSEFGNVVIKFLKGNMTVQRGSTIKLVVSAS